MVRLWVLPNRESDMQHHSHSQAGFTLLELIIVIISLLIIGAIIFFIGQ